MLFICLLALPLEKGPGAKYIQLNIRKKLKKVVMSVILEFYLLSSVVRDLQLAFVEASQSDWKYTIKEWIKKEKNVWWQFDRNYDFYDVYKMEIYNAIYTWF